MAAVMIIGCFSVMAFAEVNDAVAKIEFKVKDITDNVVTFEVWLESTDEIGTLGAFDALYIGYDSRVFEDIDNLKDATGVDWDKQNTVITAGYPCDNNYMGGSDSWIMKNPIDLQPNEVDIAKGWDTILWFNMSPDSADDDYLGNPAACLAFKLKLKDDAPANGCYSVGVSDASINGSVNTVLNEELGGIYGASGADLGFSTAKVFELVDATVEAGPVEKSIITPMSSQIRFQGIGADKDKTNYNNYFDVRTRAKIANDDFVATFGADGEKLEEIGFIYASILNVTDFKMATAQAVAQGTDATEGYVKYSCKYVQHTGDGADYIFTCLIADIKDTDANKQDGVRCVAFAKDTDGNYYFYSDVTTVSYGSLYTTYMPA